MLAARLLPLLALLLLADYPSPRAEVRVAGGRVTIEARNVPLSQLLDRISEASGMTVTYEGERPSTPVTVNVEGLSEVAAVLQLMEGLGISYFIRTDASGSGVDVLIISGPGGGGTVTSVKPSAHVDRSLLDSPQEEPIEEYAKVPIDPEEAEAAAAAQTHLDPAVRFMGLPPPQFPSGVSPAPQFPSGVSYPTN